MSNPPIRVVHKPYSTPFPVVPPDSLLPEHDSHPVWHEKKTASEYRTELDVRPGWTGEPCRRPVRVSESELQVDAGTFSPHPTLHITCSLLTPLVVFCSGYRVRAVLVRVMHYPEDMSATDALGQERLSLEDIEFLKTLRRTFESMSMGNRSRVEGEMVIQFPSELVDGG